MSEFDKKREKQEKMAFLCQLPNKTDKICFFWSFYVIFLISLPNDLTCFYLKLPNSGISSGTV